MSARAREYWEANKGDYPFHATAMIGSPRPDEYDRVRPKAMPHGFIYCPIGGLAWWGFVSEGERDYFVNDFDATPGQWEDMALAP